MTSPETAQKPLILVVDDEEPIRKMLVAMLSDIARVETAKHGMQALAWLSDTEEVPNVVITDVMMPKLDGVEFAKRLKNMPKLAKIPIVMLTARNSPQDFVAGVNAGARHYVAKPFTRMELLEIVEPFLKRG